MKKTTYSDLTAKGLSLVLAGGAVLTISVAANAQPGPPEGDRGPGHLMERADADGDGNVSLEEFQAFHAKMGAELFARMDSNSDGVINGEDKGPGPRGDGEFGRRGDVPRGEGKADRRGDGPRGEGKADRHGDGPRGEGEFGRRGDGPRGEGRHGDGPRGEGKFARRGDGPRGDGARGPGMFLEKADTDGDGGVSLEELQAVRPDATAEHFSARDINGDGVLSEADRPEGNGDRGPHGRRGPHGPEGMMKDADADGDGGVSLEELQAVFPEATAEGFAKRDRNGDGLLNREDHPEGGPGRRGPHGPRDN